MVNRSTSQVLCSSTTKLRVSLKHVVPHKTDKSVAPQLERTEQELLKHERKLSSKARKLKLRADRKTKQLSLVNWGYRYEI